MDTLDSKPLLYAESSTSISHFYFPEEGAKIDRKKVGAKISATALSLIIMNQAVPLLATPVQPIYNIGDRSFVSEPIEEKEDRQFYQPSNSHGNLLIDEEGVKVMNNDVTHKDIENTEKLFDAKLETIDAKIDGISHQLTEIKELIQKNEQQIAELPTKESVELANVKLENKIKHWGWGLLLGIPTLAQALEWIASNFLSQ